MHFGNAQSLWILITARYLSAIGQRMPASRDALQFEPFRFAIDLKILSTLADSVDSTPETTLTHWQINMFTRGHMAAFNAEVNESQRARAPRVKSLDSQSVQSDLFASMVCEHLNGTSRRESNNLPTIELLNANILHNEYIYRVVVSRLFG